MKINNGENFTSNVLFISNSSRGYAGPNITIWSSAHFRKLVSPKNRRVESWIHCKTLIWYKTGMHLETVFRHELGIPDGRFPKDCRDASQKAQ
jgi:hypothetical protein